MDFRPINTLKRYLEAGGEGIVVIKGYCVGKNWMAVVTKMEYKRYLQRIKPRWQPSLSFLPEIFFEKELSVAISYGIGDNCSPGYGNINTIAVADSAR